MPCSISSVRTSASSEVLPLYEDLSGVSRGESNIDKLGSGRGVWYAGRTTEYDRFSSESGGVMKADDSIGQILGVKILSITTGHCRSWKAACSERDSASYIKKRSEATLDEGKTVLKDFWRASVESETERKTDGTSQLILVLMTSSERCRRRSRYSCPK